MSEPQRIVSRANPLIVALRRLVRDGGSYRRLGRVWIEGEHLCCAARERGVAVEQALVTDRGWSSAALRDLAGHAARVARLPESLFAELSGLESPAAIGYVVRLPEPPAIDRTLNTLVLDRVQDPGNVGSMLRSAAALGVPQVIALEGTAALWSPKVLRAGMGSHFALRLIEGFDGDEFLRLGFELVGTSSHAGESLPLAELPQPAAWLFGHEGQGASAALLSRCRRVVRIPQPGGEESLNVAAAAAICLYEALRRGQ